MDETRKAIVDSIRPLRRQSWLGRLKCRLGLHVACTPPHHQTPRDGQLLQFCARRQCYWKRWVSTIVIFLSWGLNLGVHSFVYANGGPYGYPQPGIFGRAMPGKVMPAVWMKVSW